MTKSTSSCTIRVIVQVRTDSARLPGKALLPISGHIPSAILAAKRAANTGRDVVLATSDRSVDDALAKFATEAGLRVFRGSANNVRARFLGASADLADDSIIVRLTADNMLPDGSLIDEQLLLFVQSSRSYQSVDMTWRDPPYGLAAELMRLGALRALASRVDTASDREHVTTSLKQSLSEQVRPMGHFSIAESAVRCTMDTFDDYQRLVNVFSGIDRPCEIGWRELLTRFTELPDASPGVSRGGGLVLGTAQLAAPYGSATQVTPAGPEERQQIVRRAICLGAVAIDTARAYPGSETTIGHALEGGWNGRIPIVTKLSPLGDLAANATASEAAAAAEISVLKSLHALGGRQKPQLMLHRASHLSDWGGAVWKRLLELRDEGYVAELGVSAQTPQEARIALSDSNVTLLQIPFNVLDWRWIDDDFPALLTSRPDVQVHVRSVFLQGLLLRLAVDWPTFKDFDPACILSSLQNLATDLGRRDVADLCISWVRSHPWIGGLVIGIERIGQLEKNATLFSREPLSAEQAAHLQRVLPRAPIALLNPASWPRAQQRDTSATP